jgi:pyochelin synthetase
VAHLVPAGDVRPAADQIRHALHEHLPSYMTPSAIVWHDSLPLTRNGKVDRARLTAMAPPATAPAATAGVTALAGETDSLRRQVGELWASVLRVPAADIGTATDFYDLGGDSLAAARIFTAVRKQFGVGITLDQLYQVRTIQAMAGFIAAAGAA